MSISSFSSLKLNRSIIGIPVNTSDLVNGLFLTINTTSNDFDYANAYELLPSIVSKLYECVESKPFGLKPKTIAPTTKDIDICGIGKQLIVVCSIGLNRTGEKIHIHLWIYNLHLFNKNYDLFCKELNKKLKGLKGISKRNEFSVKSIPCTDPIDKQVRECNHSNQAVVDYIVNREYNTLMNYFSTKNNKNFIYFY